LNVNFLFGRNSAIVEEAAMRSNELRWIGLALVLTMVVAAAVGADGGRPNRAVLNEMGLGGLTVISDDQAMAVRGRGFMGSSADAFGNSFATFDSPLGTSHSENGYAAEGEHIAFGKNYSEAGVGITIGRGPSDGGMGAVRQRSRWAGRVVRVGRPGSGRPGGGNQPSRPNVAAIKVFARGFSFAAAH
jgi:hypothetical protein